MTPNFFRLNYNMGRTHSGMIAYLAELWQNGNEAPLQVLTEGLGVPAIPSGTKLTPKLEYNNIDLALLDQEGKPLLLLEMKVDDAESWKKLGKTDIQRFKGLQSEVKERCFAAYNGSPEYMRQTELYTLRHNMALGDAPRCAFVTLGTGEWREQFTSCGEVWKHCGLEQFVRVIQKIDLPNDELFQQWKAALEKELWLREHCWDAATVDAEADSGDRRGLLPLMRLGDLRQMLYELYDIERFGYAPHVHKTGPGPDTLMTFDWPNDKQQGGYRYCEINNNGKLNFKMYFYGKEKSREVKEQQVADFQQILMEVFPEQLQPKEGGKYGKSKTVARLDISLQPWSLLPTDSDSPQSVAATVANYLEVAQEVLSVVSLQTAN